MIDVHIHPWEKMIKGNLYLYVDRELVNIAKTKGINLSQLFNDYLKQVLELPEVSENPTLALEEQIKKLQFEKAVVLQKLNELQGLLNIKQKQEEEHKTKELEGWSNIHEV